MSQALFGIDNRRDPSRERLAALVSEVGARERGFRLHLRLPRRSRQSREERA